MCYVDFVEYWFYKSTFEKIDITYVRISVFGIRIINFRDWTSLSRLLYHHLIEISIDHKSSAGQISTGSGHEILDRFHLCWVVLSIIKKFQKTWALLRFTHYLFDFFIYALLAIASYLLLYVLFGHKMSLKMQ